MAVCVTAATCSPALAAPSTHEGGPLGCLVVDGIVYRVPSGQSVQASAVFSPCAPSAAAPSAHAHETPKVETLRAPAIGVSGELRVIRSSAAAPRAARLVPWTPDDQAPGVTAIPHDWISAMSRERGLDPKFVHAVIHVESRYQPHARSPMGALGLMQIMPATGARYGVGRPADLLDPVTNVSVGTQYLRDLSEMFDGRPDLVAAAYNIGEGRVIANGYKVPMVTETQDYVRQILAAYGRHP